MRDQPSMPAEPPSERPQRRRLPIAEATPDLLRTALPRLVDDAPWHNGVPSATRDQVITHVVEHARAHLALVLADKPHVTSKNYLVNVCVVGRRWVLDDVAGRARLRLASSGMSATAAAGLADRLAVNVVDASASDDARTPWWIARPDCPLDDLAVLVLLRILPLLGVWARVHAATTRLLIPDGLSAGYVKELRQSVLSGAGGHARVTVAMRPRLTTLEDYCSLLGSTDDDLEGFVTVLLADRIRAARRNNVPRWAPHDARRIEQHIEQLCRTRPGLAEAVNAGSARTPAPRAARANPRAVMEHRTVDDELSELAERGPLLARRWGIAEGDVPDLVQDAALHLLEQHRHAGLIVAGTWLAAMSQCSGPYRRRPDGGDPERLDRSPTTDNPPDDEALAAVEPPEDVVDSGERAVAYLELLSFFAHATDETNRPEVVLARELLSDASAVVSGSVRFDWDTVRSWAYPRIEAHRFAGDWDILTRQLRAYLKQLVADVLPDVAAEILEEGDS